MRIEFDDGTLLLRDAPDNVPYAEWDDRVDEYRTKRIDIERSSNGPVHGRTETNKQRCTTASLPRSKTPLGPTPISTSRQRSTSNHRTTSRPPSTPGSTTTAGAASSSPGQAGKTFLGLQAIADAGVSALVVTPTIDLMNQWHATLTNAFGEQLPEPVGVLGGGSHNVTAITVTTYDSAYRYINEYGDQFGLLVVDDGTPPASADLPSNP